MMRLRYSGASVPGCLNNHSPGFIHADQERGIFILMREVGELPLSEHAMASALHILGARLEREIGGREEKIREAITLTNNELYSISQTEEPKGERACAVTVLIVEAGEIAVGLVDDTQVYKVTPHHIARITSDSRHVKTGAGFDTASADRDSPSVTDGIPRIGVREHDPDDANFIYLRKASFEPDSALLLCSSSVSRAVYDEDMLRIIKRHPGNRARVVRSLIAAAGEAVEEDCVSVLFIEGPGFARELRSLQNRIAYSASH